MNRFFLLLFLSAAFRLQAQNVSQYSLKIGPFAANKDLLIDSMSVFRHSAVQPMRIDEEETVLMPSKKYGWIRRKLFQEHLLQTKGQDYELSVDFIPDWVSGYDIAQKKSTYINTRGVQIQGNLGDKVSFYSSFFENQANFQGYVNSYIDSTKVIPGQGHVHTFLKPGYDFSSSVGYVSYTPSKFFNFKFGHDKNFIGDGYRSLLLSDNSFNYPFLRITTNVWRIQYTNIYAQLMDFSTVGFSSFGIPRKYLAAHYLDWNVTKRFTLGLYEAIMATDRTYGQGAGLDVNYWNPIIFFRPVEYSVGSANNALLGLTFRYKVATGVAVYGQFLLDEFSLQYLKANNGWWANKYAGQLGVKAKNIAKVRGFNGLLELNTARPYMYSHYVVAQNYGHYNQSLAHPLQANFYEGQSIFTYSVQRWALRTQVMYAVYGDDPGNGKSVGHNIYLNYNQREKEFGNYITQGNLSKVLYTDIKVSYVVNPLLNLRVELGYNFRDFSNNNTSDIGHCVSIGLRSSFRNAYYDF